MVGYIYVFSIDLNNTIKSCFCDDSDIDDEGDCCDAELIYRHVFKVGKARDYKNLCARYRSHKSSNPDGKFYATFETGICDVDENECHRILKASYKLVKSVIKKQVLNNFYKFLIILLRIKTDMSCDVSVCLDTTDTNNKITQKPYSSDVLWNETSVNASKKVIASSKIDSIALNFDLVDSSEIRTIPNSWVPVRSTRTKNKAEPICWKKYADECLNKNIPAKPTFKGKSTRIYPTTKQQKHLKRWMDDARYAYNITVSELQGTTDKVYEPDRNALRKKFVTKKDNTTENERLRKSFDLTPSEIRAKAVSECCQAHNLSISNKGVINPIYKSLQNLIEVEEKRLVKINSIQSTYDEYLEKHEELLGRMKDGSKQKLRKTETIAAFKIKSELKYKKAISGKLDIDKLEEKLKHIPKFISKVSKLSFRRRKDQYEHIFIPKANAFVTNEFVFDPETNTSAVTKTDLTIYKTLFGAPIKVKNNIEINHDFQIRHHKKLNVWHVITSEETKCVENKMFNQMISIDPGIRTFLTCVDQQGNVFEIGKDWSQNKKIKRRIDKMDKTKELSKMNIDGRRKKGFERIEALKAKKHHDLHRRKLFNMIDHMHKQTANALINNYDVIVLPKLRSKSILKSVDGLGKTVNRHISLLAHCKFHDYLRWKAALAGKIVIDQDESYTSKTCYTCGLMNDIGASKIYECGFCNNKCDRDVQSCLNILTKFMSRYSSHQE